MNKEMDFNHNRELALFNFPTERVSHNEVMEAIIRMRNNERPLSFANCLSNDTGNFKDKCLYDDESMLESRCLRYAIRLEHVFL